MDNRFINFIHSGLDEAAASFTAARQSQHFVEQIAQIAECWTGALRAGGKILLAGNGGSAADAQHIAAELVSRLNYDRAPLAGIALTTDTSALTAIGNDYGYEHVFSRQVLGLASPHDVFVGISTSGRSPNILAAFTAARSKGARTVGFTGEGDGPFAAHCDLILNAPSSRTPVIQQVHITAAHIICGIVEQALFPKAGA